MSMLNDRKIKILQAIVNDYITTAEPVGSRTIAKKYELGISSATIRNEMSDLEEMGFIIQPHASAGRIPSDKGYRLYVDQLMQYRDLTENEKHLFNQLLLKNIDQIDYLMQETAKAISQLTNYTAIVTEPIADSPKIKLLRMFPLDESSIMLLMVTEENVTYNQVVKTDHVPDEDTLHHISLILNGHFKGLTFADIDQTLIATVKPLMGEYDYFLDAVLLAMEKYLTDHSDVNIHMSGTNHILTFPEFSDIEKAKAIFKTFEEKDLLVTLLGLNREEDIKILIGSENTLDQMKDCSVITTTYGVDGKAFGSIGILGPTRMNYAQVVSVLNGIAHNIDRIIKALSGG